jgi:hypothetical protein
LSSRSLLPGPIRRGPSHVAGAPDITSRPKISRRRGPQLTPATLKSQPTHVAGDPQSSHEQGPPASRGPRLIFSKGHMPLQNLALAGCHWAFAECFIGGPLFSGRFFLNGPLDDPACAGPQPPMRRLKLREHVVDQNLGKMSRKQQMLTCRMCSVIFLREDSSALRAPRHARAPSFTLEASRVRALRGVA